MGKSAEDAASAELRRAENRRRRLYQKREKLLAETGRSGQDIWPQCETCGEADIRCLRLHHVARRKHGDFQAVVCANCHEKLSGYQIADPPWKSSAPALLNGLADLLRQAADHLNQGDRFSSRSSIERGPEDHQ